MTTITAGMTPDQFITAMNANVAEVGFTGRSVTFTKDMEGWELKSALYLNSLGTYNYGRNDQYVATLNSIFNNISLADISIAGATDVKEFGAVGDGVTDDAAAIQSAVNAGNIIIQNGTFLKSTSIKIPSNRTIYHKNCTCKMADGSYDNHYRNSDLDNGNTNISLIGLGHAELDGNAANNSDAFTTYGTNRTVPKSNLSYRYVGMMFCKVTGFEVSGLHIYDYPHWDICFQKATNGSFHDCIVNYNTLIGNQDGSAIAQGSNNITIYNLAITCGDDCFGMSASNYSDLSYSGLVDWNVGDVHDITFRDIKIYDMLAGSSLAIVAGDGGKIYNISQDNIKIVKGGSIFYNYYTTYRDTPPTEDDVYNFTLNNIRIDKMQTRTYCFYFGDLLKDFIATNIVNNTGNDMYVLNAAVDNNVKINGVQVN